MRRDDRDLATRQLIHQRRLADIRRTRNRDHEAIAQTFARPCAASTSVISPSSALIFSSAGAINSAGTSPSSEKSMPASISAGRLDDLRAPVARAVAEQTFQLTQRLAALPIGVGVDEIVETFGLGEIELAVLERAARELAGSAGTRHFQSPTAPRRATRAPRVRHGRETRRRPRRSRWPVRETRAPPHRRSAGRSASRSSTRVAIRGAGIFPASCLSAAPDCGPDTRTMAIALGGRPDDRAKMVWSRGCMAY